MNPYAAALVAPYQEQVARTVRQAVEAGCAPSDLCEHLAYALAMETARHLADESDAAGLRRAADALLVAEHEVTRLAADVTAIRMAHSRPAGHDQSTTLP